MKSQILMFLVITSLLACGQQKKSSHPEPDVTDNRTLLLTSAPFIDELKKDSLKICILRPADYRVEAEFIKSSTQSAIEAWMDPLENLAPKLPSSFEFHVVETQLEDYADRDIVEKKCGGDYSLAIVGVLDERYDPIYQVNSPLKERRSFALPSSKQIWILPSQVRWAMVHEVGHIFGLGDYYREGMHDCRVGFKDSVMCHQDDILPADRLIVQRSYCVRTKGENPACFNHEKASLAQIYPESPEGFGLPFVSCQSSNTYFYASPYFIQMGSGEKPENYEVYSQDDLGIRDLYNDGSFEWTFEVAPVEDGPEIHNPFPVSIKYLNDSLSVSVQKEGGTQLTFSNCSFHEDAVALLTKKGVNPSFGFLAKEGEPIQFRNITVRDGALPGSFFANSTEELSKMRLRIYEGSGRTTPVLDIPLSDKATFSESAPGTIFVWFNGEAVLPKGNFLMFIEDDSKIHAEFSIKSE